MATLNLGNFGNAIARLQTPREMVNPLQGVLEGTASILNEQAQHIQDIKQAQSLELKADISQYENLAQQTMDAVDQEVIEGLPVENYRTRIDELNDSKRQAILDKWEGTEFTDYAKQLVNISDSAVQTKAFEKERVYVNDKKTASILTTLDEYMKSGGDPADIIERSNQLIDVAPWSEEAKAKARMNIEDNAVTGYWDKTIASATDINELSSINVDKIKISDNSRASLVRSIIAKKNQLEAESRAKQAYIGDSFNETTSLIITGDLSIAADKLNKDKALLIGNDNPKYQDDIAKNQIALDVTTKMSASKSEGVDFAISDYLSDEQKKYLRDKPLLTDEITKIVRGYSANISYRKNFDPLSLSFKERPNDLLTDDGYDANAMYERSLLVQNDNLPSKGILYGEAEINNTKALLNSNPMLALDFFGKLKESVKNATPEIQNKVIRDTLIQLNHSVTKDGAVKTDGSNGWMTAVAVTDNPEVASNILQGQKILGSMDGSAKEYQSKFFMFESDQESENNAKSFGYDEVNELFTQVNGNPSFGNNMLVEREGIIKGLQAYLVGKTQSDAISGPFYSTEWVKQQVKEYTDSVLGAKFTLNPDEEDLITNNVAFIPKQYSADQMRDIIYDQYSGMADDSIISANYLSRDTFMSNAIIQNTDNPDTFLIKFKNNRQPFYINVNIKTDRKTKDLKLNERMIYG